MTGNRGLVSRYLREAWADGDGDGLDALLSPDFCDTTPRPDTATIAPNTGG